MKTLNGYTPRALLVRAFNKITPDNWLRPQGDEFLRGKYIFGDRACIIGRCSLIAGVTPLEVEEFLWSGNFNVSSLIDSNDRSPDLETFKERAADADFWHFEELEEN